MRHPLSRTVFMLLLLASCATEASLRDSTSRVTQQMLEDQAKNLEAHGTTQGKVAIVDTKVDKLLTDEQKAQVREEARAIVQERAAELQKEIKDLESLHNNLNQDYSEKVRARWSFLTSMAEAVAPVAGQLSGGLIDKDRVNGIISDFLGDPQKAVQVSSAINLETKLAPQLARFVPTEALQATKAEMEAKVAALGLSPDQVSELKGKPSLMEMLLSVLGAAGAGGVLAKTGKSRAQKDVDELWSLVMSGRPVATSPPRPPSASS